MTATDTTVYNPSAEVYERELVPAIFRSWAAELVDLAAPRPGERVLDVACGTGIVARTAAARVGPGGTVVGYDLNPAMLAVAHRESARLRPTITWQQGTATALPFADASFDVVCCQQGAQFFDDRARGLAELRRVVTPRGRVALSVWRGLDQHPVYRALDEVLSGHLDPGALAGSDAPFSMGDADALRALLREVGFGHVDLRISIGTVRFSSAEHMLSAIGGAHAPLAAALTALDPAARHGLFSDLATALHPYTDDDGIAYPMVSSVVLARP